MILPINGPATGPDPQTSADLDAAAILARRLVIRDDGRCAACGVSGDQATMNAFHRPRSQRTPDMTNFAAWLLLCGSSTEGCLMQVIEEPRWARTTGLTLAAHKDPTSVGVWHAFHGLVFLDADGGLYPRVGQVRRGCDER
ncbi:hypothetical protein [Actinomadura rudentiformis]|uniref:Uncharacterized protein n=1 Tax=Actinomadura rudentiformis TaxID=359158 RepID=A0A6H9YI06_9ACTN|nr:hypothetical protein [Actinomadura rudentiformis]KAB2344827.1 hypothetical protein F8566_30005 [Actinomadura rudentiformis]